MKFFLPQLSFVARSVSEGDKRFFSPHRNARDARSRGSFCHKESKKNKKRMQETLIPAFSFFAVYDFLMAITLLPGLIFSRAVV
jgi:hypothetical protein